MVIPVAYNRLRRKKKHESPKEKMGNMARSFTKQNKDQTTSLFMFTEEEKHSLM